MNCSVTGYIVSEAASSLYVGTNSLFYILRKLSLHEEQGWISIANWRGDVKILLWIHMKGAGHATVDTSIILIAWTKIGSVWRADFNLQGERREEVEGRVEATVLPEALSPRA